MIKYTLVCTTLLIGQVGFSQQTKEYPEAIEDNSYLIEEAYNQEQRVVQHISNGYLKTKPDNAFVYSFTQEWPVTSVRHQLSYTVPYTFLNADFVNGIGDIMINYRYQLFYKESWACVAPRLSFILPTGNKQNGTGMNTLGYQLNLPVSKRISDHWVAHFNAGTTFYPNVKTKTFAGNEIKKNLSFYTIGSSIIWLTGTKFNIMFECLENLSSVIDLNGNIIHSNETILNPGLRAAIDIKNLQIVPGISFPISIIKDYRDTAVFIYLSFEHPF